ncbi:DUF4145 domain-containing protein [Lysobacter sp. CA196]|uniref:DUF4145 domain-containing protein n=1 Tax=Lysobacter sp. CA196 TaxID=3455606 RepID=UPI003F8D1AC5
MTVPPSYRLSAFNCPHCGAYAHMEWHYGFYREGWRPDDDIEAFHEADIDVSIGACCSEQAIWRTRKDENSDWVGELIHPAKLTAAPPHPEMPPNISVDFEEARAVASASPRAAAALLRLCVQKLCVELGESGRNINDDIASLVGKGLNPQVKQMLDVVRVVGNNAVHPGQIAAGDVAAITNHLFELVNYIVEDQIARPKKIAQLHASLPASALAGIQQRDAKAAQDGGGSP